MFVNVCWKGYKVSNQKWHFNMQQKSYTGEKLKKQRTGT